MVKKFKTEKIEKIVTMIERASMKVEGVLMGAMIAASYAANEVGCTDLLSGKSTSTVSIDPNNITSKSIFNGIVLVICAIMGITGMIKVVPAVGSYIEAKGEDNSVAENKAVKQLVTGVALIAFPSIIAIIFAS